MIEIRKALDYEKEKIKEMRLKAYIEHSASIPEEHWKALKKAITSDADGQPGVEMFVAEVEEKIFGSVALFPARSDAYKGIADILDYPEIRMLAVDVQARGKGIGKLLIQKCIEQAKTYDSTCIGLHTADFMKVAMHLYEEMGFVRLPQFDFEPARDGIIVKAYRFSFA
ncbi:GNAT family N-acetyltransferase [Bacillus sp. EB600]|uniref:GNAT family N-acetyltransferase n=1 Tax=Bacillus sp. EB600 TaxID=2806345 RepID=UPI00210DC2A9|nr:GNAT family N-acetyltransferase [Bacillus sp. EB600]MCQ6282805.1 GNAT family N-acetyltransferase [Bacillus sp. EB600]